MVYYILFILIMGGAFAEFFGIKRKQNKMLSVYYACILLVIFLMGSLRWERGTDWNSYYKFFINPWTGFDTHFEPGYVLLNIVVRSITDNYSIFLTVETGIYMALLASLFKRIRYSYIEDCTRDYTFALLLFQYAMGFAGIFMVRSQLAALICMHALLDIKDRKKWRFIITIILAATIHKSSLIFLIAYPIYHIKCSKELFYSCEAVMTAILLFFPKIISDIMLRIPALTTYSMYFSNVASPSITMGILKWFGLFVAVLLFSNKVKNEIVDSLLRVFSLGIVTYCLSSLYSSVMFRLSFLFFESFLALIPQIMNAKWGKNREIIFLIFTAFCLVSLVMNLNGGYRDLYIPYKTIFDNFEVVTF